MAIIPVGDWRPDLPPLGGGDITAKNVIPHKQSYLKFPSASVVSSGAMTARAQGFYTARDSAANVYNYSGDATKLYQYNSVAATFTDVSRSSGGAYATASEGWWEMAQWGQTVISVNGVDSPQEITLGASNFTALAGSPPVASHIAVVRDFVVLGNISTFPNRVRWSAINNSQSWAVSAATQADYQDLQGDGGWVQRVIGGEYGIVVQEKAIWRMTYVGSPVIFQFDLVDRFRGTPCPQSVVGYGQFVFFLADDGFYAFDGVKTVPIGNGKVDNFFLNDLQTTYSYRVNAQVDPIRKIVAWAYPGSGSSGGTPNKILLYSWPFEKWSVVEVDTEMLARFVAGGYTLDTLDTVSSSLDSLPASLDSRIWSGGALSFGSINTDHKIATFSGSAMTATVDTVEVQHFPGQRAEVTSVRPLVDGGTATVAVGARTTQAGAVSFASAVSPTTEGECPVRSNNRYHRYRISTTGDFNHIAGITDIEASPVGGR
jgi:hypothetical protein